VIKKKIILRSNITPGNQTKYYFSGVTLRYDDFIHFGKNKKC